MRASSNNTRICARIIEQHTYMRANQRTTYVYGANHKQHTYMRSNHRTTHAHARESSNNTRICARIIEQHTYRNFKKGILCSVVLPCTWLALATDRSGMADEYGSDDLALKFNLAASSSVFIMPESLSTTLALTWGRTPFFETCDRRIWVLWGDARALLLRTAGGRDVLLPISDTPPSVTTAVAGRWPAEVSCPRASVLDGTVMNGDIGWYNQHARQKPPCIQQ